MGVGARVGAPVRQARSSVFWLSFKRARAGRVPSVVSQLAQVKELIVRELLCWLVLMISSAVARPC